MQKMAIGQVASSGTGHPCAGRIIRPGARDGNWPWGTGRALLQCFPGRLSHRKVGGDRTSPSATSRRGAWAPPPQVVEDGQNRIVMALGALGINLDAKHSKPDPLHRRLSMRRTLGSSGRKKQPGDREDGDTRRCERPAGAWVPSRGSWPAPRVPSNAIIRSAAGGPELAVSGARRWAATRRGSRTPLCAAEATPR